MTERNYWYEKPDVAGGVQFLWLILWLIGGIVLAAVVSRIVLLFHYGGLSNLDATKMPWGLTSYMLFVQGFCGFGVSAIAFSKSVKRREDYFYVHQKSSFSIWLIVIGMAVAALFVSDLFSRFTEWIPLSKNLAAHFKALEKTYDEDALRVLNYNTFGTFLISLCTIALQPAIFEELFFRGALQQVLIAWTKKPLAGIIIASVIFSALHFSYYGFLSRALLGAVLGLVYYYGKNIWLNMLIHFINNATVAVTLYISCKGKPLTADVLDNSNNQSSPLYLQLAGLAVLILLMNIFIKKTKPNNAQFITHNS